MWNQFVDTFTRNFIDGGNWHYIAEGLLNTIKITFFAVLLGIVIGLIVGTIRSTYDKTHKLKVLNFLCNIYLTVIRGTPVLVPVSYTHLDVYKRQLYRCKESVFLRGRYGLHLRTGKP